MGGFGKMLKIEVFKEMGFQVTVVVKTLPANAGDVGLHPLGGEDPRAERKYSNPLQYSCL